MKKVLCLIMISMGVLFLAGCRTWYSPYTEDEVIKQAKDLYGEDITYTGKGKSEKIAMVNHTSTYNFTSAKGFDFSLTTGTSTVRYKLIIPIKTRYISSTYMQSMVNYYAEDLQSISDKYKVTSRWDDQYTNKLLHFDIRGPEDMNKVAAMLVDTKKLLNSTLPDKDADVDITLAKEVRIYGYYLNDNDYEMGCFWYDLYDCDSKDEILQALREGYKENITDMNMDTN